MVNIKELSISAINISLRRIWHKLCCIVTRVEALEQGGGNFVPLTGTEVGVPITGDLEIINTDPLAKGITSTEDYSSNITNLDYVQKIYVDTAIQNQISQSNVGNKLYLFYSFS